MKTFMPGTRVSMRGTIETIDPECPDEYMVQFDQGNRLWLNRDHAHMVRKRRKRVSWETKMPKRILGASIVFPVTRELARDFSGKRVRVTVELIEQELE